MQGGLAALNALTRLKLREEVASSEAASPNGAKVAAPGPAAAMTGASSSSNGSSNGVHKKGNNHAVVASDSK